MSENIIRKPVEAMSQLERDIYFGEWKDLDEERKEFGRAYGEEEKIGGIFDLVSAILKGMANSGRMGDAQAILCNPISQREAWWVGKYFNIDVILDTRVPDDEFIVVKKSEADLVARRRLAMSTSMPSGLMQSMQGVRRYE